MKGLEELMDAIAGEAKAARIDWKTSVRRVVGTSDWRHDPERLAAAQAKRERKQSKRATPRQADSSPVS